MEPHQLLRDLYEFDSKIGEGRLCPRLTPSHLDPTSFEKMNVSRAMQILLLNLWDHQYLWQSR